MTGRTNKLSIMTVINIFMLTRDRYTHRWRKHSAARHVKLHWLHAYTEIFHVFKSQLRYTYLVMCA